MSQRHYHTTIAAHSYRPVRETCALYTPANTTFARVSLLPACNSYVSHVEDEVVVGLRSQSMDSLNPHPPCPFVPGAPSRCRAFLPSSLHPLCHGILLPALLPYRVCPPHEPLQGRFSVSVRNGGLRVPSCVSLLSFLHAWRRAGGAARCPASARGFVFHIQLLSCLRALAPVSFRRRLVVPWRFRARY